MMSEGYVQNVENINCGMNSLTVKLDLWGIPENVRSAEIEFIRNIEKEQIEQEIDNTK